jgi:hypothetical protein
MLADIRDKVGTLTKAGRTLPEAVVASQPPITMLSGVSSSSARHFSPSLSTKASNQKFAPNGLTEESNT